MKRDRSKEIMHLRRSLGEFVPYVYKKLESIGDWKYDGRKIVNPPLKWEGDMAVFEREIEVEDPATYLEAWFGGEALVIVDGKAYGQLNPVQKRLWVGKLADGNSHRMRIEVVPRGMFGTKENATFEMANLLVIDEELLDAITFVENVIDVASVIEDETLFYQLVTVTDDFLSSVWPPRESSTYLKVVYMDPSVTQKIARLWNPPPKPVISEIDSRPFRESFLEKFELYKKEIKALKERFGRQGKVYLVGHAHIDYAWLWPIDETKRKIRRTFSNALLLMEKHPSLLYAQSSAQMYKDAKEIDPELYSRIKKAAIAGRWEPVGGMWVESDCIVPSMESLVRQFYYGQKFFEKEFGERSKVAWLPDVFGFSHIFPQILHNAGMELFVTTKLNWNEADEFPYDLCVWRGLDGSEVLYYSFKNPEEGYNSRINAKAFIHTWKNYRQKDLIDAILISFGYGDGGGGPSDEMCRRLQNFQDIPGIPEIKMATIKEFKEYLLKQVEKKSLPVWDGELYLELHRGTFTSQSRTKYFHRMAEVSLRNLEILSVVLNEDIQKEIDDRWKVVLYNEFHDILPGSSIREVYQQTEKELKDTVKWAQGKMKEIWGKKASCDDSLTLVNFSSAAQRLVFEIEKPLALELNSRRVSCQKTWKGTYIYKATWEEVPPLGFKKIKILGEEIPDEFEDNTLVLENRHLKVTVHEDGSFEIFSKTHNKEVFKEPARLWIYKNLPYNWDNWDIDVNYYKSGKPLLAKEVKVVESGPVRKTVRASFEFEGSKIDQYISLEEDDDVVRIELVADWHTRRSLLKAVFPLNLLARKALFDVDGGYVERSTTMNTNYDQARFEVPHHRWVSLSQRGFGVAILNEAKYGSSVKGSNVGLSLIKAGIFPDFYVDEGEHVIRYGVLVHDGDVEKVIRRAEEFSNPLQVFEGSLSYPKHLEIKGGIFKILALKRAENGEVLRVVEVGGASGKAEVTLPKKMKVYLSNILEDKLSLVEEDVDHFDLNYEPFKMYTFLLET